MIDNLIFHNDVFFVMKRNCLYVYRTLAGTAEKMWRSRLPFI